MHVTCQLLIGAVRAINACHKAYTDDLRAGISRTRKLCADGRSTYSELGFGSINPTLLGNFSHLARKMQSPDVEAV